MTAGPAGPVREPVRQRSWAEVRWRQFRNAPRPVVRAVLSSLVIADRPGVAYLVYDVALSRGAALPGGDLRVLAMAVLRGARPGRRERRDLPRRPAADAAPGARRRRSGWSAALGFFAAVPIAYLVMVVAVQVIRPLFG